MVVVVTVNAPERERAVDKTKNVCRFCYAKFGYVAGDDIIQVRVRSE